MIRAMPLLTVFAMILALSGCGADGEPTRPEERPAPGIQISGTAEFGLAEYN